MTKQYPTKQYLSEVISNREFAESVPPEIVIVMARQLLASMVQEPVYQVLGDGSWTDYSKQQLEDLLESKPSTLFRVAYAAPQLPQSAVVPDAIEIDDDFDSAFEHGKAVGWNAYRAAMTQGDEPVSQPDELPMDYQQGHKDGLEWAARLAEANHPQTGDWLYDDPLELAKAIRKGPDMPTAPVQKLTLREGLAAIRNLGPIDAEKIQAERDALNEPTCWCHTCRPVTMTDMRFVVCPDCGNKRCPHANDHRNACTGSNEPGQEGSAYPAAPQQEVK